ncbi:hypothetical protein [Williamsia deligens]|uniref:Uncharacterized protein n=1 Tax=Williamsia deligens TaxID=321325 RepID=A0ABW3GD46_9NOCA|nr:hypothetical protein [Williamsia deligens]MCP2196322.1 hypothetical protein [Williamsia deligens]
MNAATITALGSCVVALLSFAGLGWNIISGRRKARAEAAEREAAASESEARRDQTFQEIAIKANNNAAAAEAQVRQMRKLCRLLYEMFSDVALPIIERERPDLYEKAREDLAQLDEMF